MKAERKRRKKVLLALSCLLVVFIVAEAAQAVVIDDKRTLEFTAKLQSRVSLRLQDSQGFTEPKLSGWDLVQWRNLALFELNHDLKYLTRQLGILHPLKALRIRAKYHVVGRFMYEAAYNVGPEEYREVAGLIGESGRACRPDEPPSATHGR